MPDSNSPTIVSATVRGIEGHPVALSIKRLGQLPLLTIVGLSNAAERETRVRVQAALAAASVALRGSNEVRCDAGGLVLDGAGLDLPIALVLAAPNDGTKESIGAIGELSLGGEVRPVRGVLSMVEALSKRTSIVLVAPENAAEARLVEGVTVLAVRTLREALDIAKHAEAHARRARDMSVTHAEPTSSGSALDLKDVVGQPHARRALEIAAAGHHHVLLVGGPGAGKTMLARRLSGILPAMTDDEALEVTRIHSAAGLNIGGGLVRTRPFRAPHHSTTPPGLVGGGAAHPRPGEVSLAHNGVLFLDELPEFARPTLEILTEPLTSGEAVLARASGTLRFPSRCLLVASMSPCPCGRAGSSRCRCAPETIKRYAERVPQRVRDLFALRVQVETLDLSRMSQAAPAATTAEVAPRVQAARARAQGDSVSIESLAFAAVHRAASSAADVDRVLRVARTVARMEAANVVTHAHVSEAVSFALNAAFEANGA